MPRWLRRLLGLRDEVPSVALEAQPVSLNATPSERELRNRARIARLEEAVKGATGERKGDLIAELKRRKGG